MFNGMKLNTFSLDNQMRVLTVSDSRFVKSSGALAVMAGSMENPSEYLGLAHFLEHMLFLGTRDFHEVGEYEDYLNRNGGGHNAYTSIDHTNYFFDVVHQAFEGALKRFSRFFVCPTFDEKYLTREKKAVHSEHEKNLKDDGRREHRFLQLITDPKHPFSRFATGDKNTLKGATREVVMDFYKKHYSSNLMCLVLMSDKSPGELRDLAFHHFSDVTNKKTPTPLYRDQLFASGQRERLHCVTTLRDHDILKISFDWPDDLPFWESKPTSFLAFLLGEEAQGSLLSFLKNQGLAFDLEVSTWWRMLHIRAKLTGKGRQKWQEVVKACFSYIELLKKEGLKKYLFDEKKMLAEVELEHIEPKSSMGQASHFSAAMLYHLAHNFLKRHYLYHKYSPEDFEKFLGRLKPENMQITFFSKQNFSEKKESYYGIEYKTEKLDSQWLKDLKSVKIYHEFGYPAPNPYIPENLKLVGKKKHYPAFKEKNYKSSVLYSQVDTEWGISKGSISLSFTSDIIAGSPKNYLLARLYSKIKKEELNEWGYPAALAGLNYSISQDCNTITVEVSGFSQHLCEFFKNLILDKEQNRRLDQVRISKELFQRLKMDYKKFLINKSQDPAYQNLLYNMGCLFSTTSVHRDQYMDLVDSVCLDEINEFSTRFFKKVFIRGFGYGNLHKEDIREVVDVFYEHIGENFFTQEQVEKFENKFIQLPKQSSFIGIRGANNNNAQLSIYGISEWSITNQAHVNVLAIIIEQPFFTELRTRQQLGYVVAAFDLSSHGFCGLGSLIQSQTHENLDLFQRSQTFLKKFLPEILNSISEEELETIKKALIREASKWPNSLSERLARFHFMAAALYGDFQFFDKFVEALKTVNKASLQSFCEPMIKGLMTGDFGTCPQVSFFYHGSESKESQIPTDSQVIDDMALFKKSCSGIQPYRQTDRV